MVAGSCGDFFDIADLVIQMDCYEPYEVTTKAKELSRGKISLRDDLDIHIDFGRVLVKGSISEGHKGIKIKNLGKDGLSINKENIDLKSVEQIVDGEQINTIGMTIKFIEDKYSGKDLTVEKIVDEIEKDLTKSLIGIDNIKGGNGSLAMPRKQEILCAINRLRTLKIKE